MRLCVPRLASSGWAFTQCVDLLCPTMLEPATRELCGCVLPVPAFSRLGVCPTCGFAVAHDAGKPAALLCKLLVSCVGVCLPCLHFKAGCLLSVWICCGPQCWKTCSSTLQITSELCGCVPPMPAFQCWVSAQCVDLLWLTLVFSSFVLQAVSQGQ